MDTTEHENWDAVMMENCRFRFAATGNPISAWRAVAAATCGYETGETARLWLTGPVLSGEELQDAFARLPPEILTYLSQCASRIMALSLGIDWRAPPVEDENGIPPNMLSHVMGTTAPPPLSPPEAASLLPQALEMVSVGSNAFSKERSEWTAELAALMRDHTLSEMTTRERLETILENFGLADERSVLSRRDEKS